ncbi:MAG: ImmA/IrrE family metallo-endopeptidase [Acidimicrobiales bacterium]
MEWSNASQGARAWRSHLEHLGIVTLQLSLGKESIRGFSVWGEFAPVVAVNTAYHPTARSYTLFHEVGHLLTRSDSACFNFMSPSRRDSRLERWCEEFAAALLLPASAVRRVASRYLNAEGLVDDVGAVRSIANRFKTSTRAASIRLQELGLAENSLYGRVDREMASYDWNSGGGGGGGQPRTEKRLGQVGLRTLSTLFDAAARGRLNERDVASHLRLSVGEVADLKSMVSIG